MRVVDGGVLMTVLPLRRGVVNHTAQVGQILFGCTEHTPPLEVSQLFGLAHTMLPMNGSRLVRWPSSLADVERKRGTLGSDPCAAAAA